MFIINLKNIRYKQSASGNIIHSVLISICDRSAIYGYIKNKKKQEKTAISRKKLSKKSVEGFKEWSFD